MILTIRTDNPQAEVGVYDTDGKQISYEKWQAHRELEGTLLKKIEDNLAKANCDKQAISGVIVFAGPGSFTGLRIGFTVANTIAAGLNIPNVKTTDENWIEKGIEKLTKTKGPSILVPEYGGEANITKPKK